jgi:hypothetical protein
MSSHPPKAPVEGLPTPSLLSVLAPGSAREPLGRAVTAGARQVGQHGANQARGSWARCGGPHLGRSVRGCLGQVCLLPGPGTSLTSWQSQLQSVQLAAFGWYKAAGAQQIVAAAAIFRGVHQHADDTAMV